MNLRRARDGADFQEFHGLQVEYEASLPPELRHELPDAAGLRIAYDEPHAAFLAFVEDAAAGGVAVSRLDASTSVLKRLYVRPAYRKLGIARALIDAVVAFSREHGHRRVVLDTDREVLQAAYRLYVALGFVECAPYGAITYECPTYMELRLDGGPSTSSG